MLELWPTLVGPIVAAVRPKTVVSVGRPDERVLLRLLQATAAEDAQIHVLPAASANGPAAPVPLDDRLEVHPARDDQRLAPIPQTDLVLLTGDANWHATFSALEHLVAVTGETPPVVLVFDAGWPHGRRDRYPDPDAVPPEARQPSRVGGLEPGVPEPLPDGGVDGGVAHAVAEGGERNGVLTAVEDWLEGAPGQWRFTLVEGFAGTAVLVPSERLEGAVGDPELGALLDALDLDEPVRAQVRALDEARLRERAGAERLKGAAAGHDPTASDDPRMVAAERDVLRAHVADLAEGGLARAEELAALRARVAALRDVQAVPTSTPVGRTELGARVLSVSTSLSLMSEQLATRRARTGSTIAVEQRDERELVRRVDALERLLEPLAALGRPGDPLPIDRHGRLAATPAGGDPPLQAVIPVPDSAAALRSCCWSILDRIDAPLSVTLVTDEPASPDAERDALVAALACTAGFSLRERDAGRDERHPAWRLVLDAPVVVPHGWAQAVSPKLEPPGAARLALPVVASPAQAPWAGLDALALVARALPASVPTSEDGHALASPAILELPGAPRDAVAEPFLPGLLGAIGAADPPPDALADRVETRDRLVAEVGTTLTIVYLVAGAGSDAVVAEALALHRLGARVSVAVPAGALDAVRAARPEAATLAVGFDQDADLVALLEDANVVVATDTASMAALDRVGDLLGDVVEAYRLGDYEPLRAPAAEPASDAAVLAYRQAAGALFYTSTHWLANIMWAAHRIPVAKVDPGVDGTLFFAPETERERGPLRVAAAIRPGMPRHRPAMTLRTLDWLARETSVPVEAISFGCSREALDDWGELPAAVVHAGELSPPERGALLRDCDVYLDLSVYDTGDATGLEAMACGAVPVLPVRGGTPDYARDGSDAVLVDATDEARLLLRLRRLLEAPDELAGLRAAGYVTAARFDALSAAASRYALLESAVADRRVYGRA